MSGRPNIAQRVEHLHFIADVDMMLAEGTPPHQVALFIQEESGELQDVTLKALARVLKTRSREVESAMDATGQKRRDGAWYAIDSDDGAETPDVIERMNVRLPSVIARGAKKRVDRGIDELAEMEALYLSQRDRIDRMIAVENRDGALSSRTSQEIAMAGELLMKSLSIKEKSGLIGTEAAISGNVRDLGSYARETAEVLQRPSSRRRIVSLVERFRRLEDSSFDEEEVVDVAAIVSGDDGDDERGDD